MSRRRSVVSQRRRRGILRRAGSFRPKTPTSPPCDFDVFTFATSITEIDGYAGSGDYDQIYPPGSVIELTAGNRGRIRLRHLHGTAACPIIVRNSSDGAVVLTSTTQVGLLIQNCRHVHFDFSNAPSETYGLKATAANDTKAVEIGKRSIHIQINNVELANCANIGMIVHTKDDTGFDYEESTPGTPSTFTGADKWVDEDIWIHHCLAHDIGNGTLGEGFYIGNNNAQTDNTPDMKDHLMHNIQSDTTTFEAFDFKAMTSGVIHDIQTDDSAYADLSQAGGIHFGNGFGGKVTDGTVTNCNGHGVNMQQAYRIGELDNVNVDNPGASDAGYKFQPTVSVDTDNGILIMENCTLINPQEDGLKFNVALPNAAALCVVRNNTFNYNTGDDCIQISNESIGTETGNTCNAV